MAKTEPDTSLVDNDATKDKFDTKSLPAMKIMLNDSNAVDINAPSSQSVNFSLVYSKINTNNESSSFHLSAKLRTLKLKNENGDITIEFKILYYIIMMLVVLLIGFYQAYLTRKDELNSINDSIDIKCNTIFNLIEINLNKSLLFGNTIIKSIESLNVNITLISFLSLMNNLETINEFDYMKTIQIVKHIKNINDFRIFENIYKNEYINSNYSNIIDFQFHDLSLNPFNITLYNNLTSYDPIIYSRNFISNPNVIGLFPYPELPREQAIKTSVLNKLPAVTSRIHLFDEIEYPIGILAFFPIIYQQNNNDVYSFLTIVYKIDEMLSSSLYAQTMNYMELYLYDITNIDDIQYLGVYPTKTINDYDNYYYSINTNNYKKIIKYNITFGQREWNLICAVKKEYIKSQLSFLAYLIFFLALIESLFERCCEYFAHKCVTKTQFTVEKNRVIKSYNKTQQSKQSSPTKKSRTNTIKLNQSKINNI